MSNPDFPPSTSTLVILSRGAGRECPQCHHTLKSMIAPEEHSRETQSSEMQKYFRVKIVFLQFLEFGKKTCSLAGVFDKKLMKWLLHLFTERV